MDLGKEIIGSIRLTVDSPKQQTVTLLYGEEKNNDGTVKSKMRTGNVYEEQWVLKKGEQTLEGIGGFCRLYGNYVEGLTVLHYFVETYFIRPKQWTKNWQRYVITN